MKKIFSILAIVLVFGVQAQTNYVQNMLNSSGLSTYTVTNTENDTATLRVQNWYDAISIQKVVSVRSGTLVSTRTLYGSLDGVAYVALTTTSVVPQAVALQSFVDIISGSPYQYYRVIGVNTSTVAVLQVKNYLLPSGRGGQTLVYSMKSASTTAVTTVTVTNTATALLDLQVQGTYKAVSIQPIVTKQSGTAAGTVTLQGSNDGINFVTVSTQYLRSTLPYSSGQAATLSVSDVTTSTGIFVLIGNPYNYYRLSYTGSGTMVTTIKGYVQTAK